MVWWLAAKPIEKAADNLLDKDKGLLTQVGNWIGGMNLTEEEVLETNATTVKQVQEFVKATLSESTDRSRSRRSIATMWFKLQAGLLGLTAIAIPLDDKIAQAYFDLATSTIMVSISTAITIFFFGSYGVARHNETKEKK